MPNPANGDWPGWRGLHRDARVAWLPEQLPDAAEFAWSAGLTSDGIGGIAVAADCVVVASRDALDQRDIIQCFGQESGDELWRHGYEAPGKLDYGNSPRATPLIDGGNVYTLGAFGQLTCIELESGIVLWQRSLNRDFAAAELTWGHAGSPLMVNDQLIVQPGGKEASLVALDPESGETLWQSAGAAASYSSLVPAPHAGGIQVIGFDKTTAGGWDAATGKRLWTIEPDVAGDFNVPTIIVDGSRLVLASENNGTRIHHLDANGHAGAEPAGASPDLAPDTHSPVIVNGFVVGVWNDLFALRLDDEFQTAHSLQDNAFFANTSLIAGPDRVLALSEQGELLLVGVGADGLRLLDRLALTDEKLRILAHPALAGDSLFARLGSKLVRLDLK